MGSRKLGINFDSEALNIVETEKQRIICHYNIPYLETQDKAEVLEVADQIRLAAILQKSLREKAIKTEEVLAAIPASEVLLRSFLIPFLPQKEIRIAIDFEARKHVPIKLDLLAFDYALQKVKEKRATKFKTHFVGVKKEILDRYVYALEQSNLKIISIESSLLSLFRVLVFKKLVKINSSIAIVEASKKEGSICIVEKGFPQLIRDFKFTAISKDIYAKEPESMSSLLNREIRLSFDYYRRQSPKEEVSHIFIFSEEKDETIKENLIKELNIQASLIRPNEIIGLKEEIKIGELKAYGASLGSLVTSIKPIDLYKKRKTVEPKEKKEGEEIPEIPISIKSVIRTSVIAVVFILLFYLFVDYSQITGLKNQIDSLSQKRLSLKHKLSSLDLSELQNIKAVYEEQINAFKEAKKVTYATPLLNALPALVPKGIWLGRTDLRLDQGLIFKMDGKAYLEDENEQINAVNKFLANIKESSEFKKIFSSVGLDYIRQSAAEKFAVTEFSITCK